MKKQVLVTVDRGETRVAMMEAAGSPSSPKDTKKGARPKAGNTPAGYRVAEIYFERRGSRSICYTKRAALSAVAPAAWQ